MEPIIDPSQIYGYSIFTKINSLSSIGIIIGVILFFIFTLARIIDYDEDENELFGNGMFFTLILTIICVLFNILTFDKNTELKMYIAKNITTNDLSLSEEELNKKINLIINILDNPTPKSKENTETKIPS